MRFGDGVVLEVEGHGGGLELRDRDDHLYRVLSLRSGTGLAVIHGWHMQAGSTRGRQGAARKGRADVPRYWNVDAQDPR